MRKIFTYIFVALLFIHIHLLSCEAQEKEMITNVVLNHIKLQLNEMISSGLERGDDKGKEWLVFKVEPSGAQIIKTWEYKDNALMELEKNPSPTEVLFVGSKKGLLNRMHSYCFYIYKESKDTFVYIEYSWMPLAAGANIYKVTKDPLGVTILIHDRMLWIS